MKKRLLAFLLALCCICSQAGIVALAEEIGDEIDYEFTSTFGDNGGFTWQYDLDTSTLRVTGEDTWISRDDKSMFEFIGSASSSARRPTNVIFEDCVFSGSLKNLLRYSNYRLESVEFINCDTSKVTDMSNMFYYCSNLKYLDISGFDTSKVTDMSNMFYYCNNLTELDVSSFDTSKVINMSNMFSYCEVLTKLDVSSFDTSKVTDMSNMFHRCKNIKSLDISEFDVSKVTNMSSMFDRCESIESISMGKFDTSNVTSMELMFQGCNKLKEIDVSNFDTSKVTNMHCIFAGCSELTELDVSGFDTSNVVNMCGMFIDCEKLTELDVSSFDTSNATDIGFMFTDCCNLVNLDVSGFDTSEVTSMSFLFEGCYRLKSLDLSNFDTSNVTKMDNMFSGCRSLTTIDISNFDTSKVTDMSGMFYECYKFTTIDLSNFDMSNVTDMRCMFKYCSNLINVDENCFNTSKVTDMAYMFSYCRSLTNLDISSFDTSNVIDMSYMFQGCTKLKQLDISGFDTLNVTNMEYMFESCTELEQLDISGLDTSNVVNMSGMFKGCAKLKQLDIRKLDTSNVSKMYYMFAGCNELKELDVTSFDTSNVTDMVGMFYGCSKLYDLDISKFDTSNVRRMSSMFEDCASLGGLNLAGFDLSRVYKGYLDRFLKNCNNLKTIYTPKMVKEAIELPGTFYDLYSNSVTQITSQDCNTVLTRNVTQEIVGEEIDDVDEKAFIWVYDSYGNVLTDVTISYGDNVCTSNPVAVFAVDKEELFTSDGLVVSKDGYATVTMDISELVRVGYHISIILYSSEEEELVLKYVSHYDEYNRVTDLLSEVKTYNIMDKNSGIKLVFSPMNSDKVVEYQLWQKNKKIATSDTGIFNVAAGDGFERGGGCFIRVIGESGLTRDTDINLSFVAVIENPNRESELMDKAVKSKKDEDVPYFGDREVEFDLDSLGYKMVVGEDKISIGINVDISKDGVIPDLKKAFDEIKQSFRDDITISKFKVQELKKHSEKVTVFKFFGIEYDVDIVGYAECNLGEREAKGQIYILLSAESRTMGFTTMVSVVPVTVHYKIGGELKGIGEVNYNFDTEEFEGEIALEFEAGIEAFGGVGVGTITGAGGYGQAKATVDVILFGENPGVQEAKIAGGLGVKAYVGPWAYKKIFAENTWTLYSAKKNEEQMLEQMNLSMYAADKYEVETLDYLSQESDWNGYPIMLDTAEVSTSFMSLLENTYLNAQPVMVANDNVLYVAFLGADETTGEIYVQCTKMENGVWCEPVRINSQSVVEDAPQLLVDNDGNIWLAYAKTGDGYETGNILSYAKNQSIVVGLLDKDTLELTNVKEYNSDDYMHMQQLSLVNGVPTVAWVESAVTDANSVLASFDNKIVLASYNDGQWTETYVVKNIDYNVSDMAMGDIGIAYVMDADGDITSMDDKKLIYCDFQGNEKNVVEGVTGNVSYGILPGETQGTFIWNATDKLCSMDDFIEISGITNEYVINNNSIYYSTPVEGSAELAVIRRNNDGTYTSPILLTETDRYIENISVATVYGRDIVLGMHTSAEVTSDDFNTSKNLVWSMVQPVNDIRIDDIYYDTEAIVSGATIPVTMTITNAGENQVDSVSISLNDNVVSTQLIELKSGENKDVTFELTCPDKLTSYKVTVEDSASDLSLDYNSDDNSVSFKLGYVNLTVDASLIKVCNSKKIIAMVTNTGVETASGSVTLFDKNGKLLSYKAIKDLEGGKSLYVDMPIDADISDTTLNVVINTQQEELYTYNNMDTVYIPLEDNEYIITYELDDGVQNSENPTNYYESDDEIVLLAPTKEGYIFDGWYSDDEFTTKIESISSDSTGDITLYSKWTEIVLKNGLQKDDNGRWYYFVDDKIDTSFTGLAKNDYGWWYVKEGKLDLTYTGLAKNEYGWWYVKDGKLNLTYTGLAKNEYGWWYVKDGKLDLTYTGLAKNDYGWWYVSDGKLDRTYTGLAKNDYGWWYVSDGKLDRTYTGLAQNEYGVWYVVEGRPKLTYTGTVEFEGIVYSIKNGKVV